MRRQVEEWRTKQISTVAANLIIYQAFVESELDAPKHLARLVHDLYFRPARLEFEPRTLGSLTNTFTSPFKNSNQYLSSMLRRGLQASCKVRQLPPQEGLPPAAMPARPPIVADAELARARKRRNAACNRNGVGA
jgi:hypothetical protein